MSTAEIANIHVERAFRDAQTVGAALAAESRDWDLDHYLKECESVVQEMLVHVAPDDVERRYALGLRLFALGLRYVSCLLEADARGEFDDLSKCVHDASEYELRQENNILSHWCRLCNSRVMRTEDGWIKCSM